MARYRVQRKASTWYEVRVEASSEAEALRLGLASLDAGEGYELSGSFEFLDESWVSHSIA